MTKTKSKSNRRLYLIIFLVIFVEVLFAIFMSYFSSAIIEAVFKFLNFFIIVALASWFFKNKQIPETKEKIAQKQLELQAKADQNKILLDRQHQFDKEIKSQEFLAQKLYDQVKTWSSSFDLQQKEIQLEQTQLTKKAIQRAQNRAEEKMSRAVSELVLVKALHNAQQALIEQFVSEQEGKSFNSVIFEYMRKEVS